MRKHLAAVALLVVGAGGALAQKMPASEALSAMEASWNKVSSYSCRMDVYSKRGRQEKNDAFRFEFKKPHLVRLKVLSGDNQGADVVYDADGRIRAAQRILGIRMKKGVGRTDPSTRSLRNVPFWEADMGSQVSSIREMMGKGEAAAAHAKEGGKDVVLLTIAWRGADTHLNDGTHRYVRTYHLDPKTYAPLLRTTTEDGTVVDRVTVSEVNLNPNLPENRFRL